MTAERFDFNAANFSCSIGRAFHVFERENGRRPTRIGINTGAYRLMIHEYGHAAMCLSSDREQIVICDMLADLDDDIAPQHIILINDEVPA